MSTVADPLTEDALEALRTLTGDPGAEFRDGQLEAIRDVVVDRARVLCVQRTGWGKSAVYFVATTLLRRAGAGPTLIVSPLLALMRNQLAAARRLGLRAHTINSTNREEWDGVRDRLAAGELDLLLISPERLNNPRFRYRDAADVRGLGRAAGDRRGALHLRLGSRLPAGLPARQGHAVGAGRRHRGAWHDRHRQRSRRLRRGRAAGGGHGSRPAHAAAHVPGSAGADEPAAGGRRAAASGAAAGMAGHASRRRGRDMPARPPPPPDRRSRARGSCTR